MTTQSLAKSGLMTLAAALAAVIVAPSIAQAQPYSDRYETYDDARAAYDCHQRRDSNTVGGAVLGSVLGAVAGSNAASRHNRTEGAVAGAVVGGVIGGSIGADSTRCRDPRDETSYYDQDYDRDAYAYDDGQYVYGGGYRRSYRSNESSRSYQGYGYNRSYSGYGYGQDDQYDREDDGYDDDDK